MKLKIVLYSIILLTIPLTGMAQVDTTATDSIPAILPDTLLFPPPQNQSLKSPADTLRSGGPPVKFKVRRWYYHAPLQADTAATDSTLRWQLWQSWINKKNRDPGVITYRLGTIARTNTMQVNAHGPEYQQLYWENIPMNDPVTGAIHWSYIPQHKIENLYENNLGTVSRTTFNLKEYYLNKPLTQLKYTQSSNKTRDLEFMISYNFSQKTNAELSYWDRRDGGGYKNSSVKGRQIYAKITHLLDHHQEIKVNFLSNKYDNSMPFGYVISNPFRFNFDQFNTQAVEPSGKGTQASSILSINYYRRPRDTTKNTSNMHADIYMNSLKRKVTYSADSTFYHVNVLGANVRKWYRAGPLKLEGDASYQFFIPKNDAQSTLATSSWGLLKGEGKAVFQPFSFLQLSGQAGYRSRSDGFTGDRLGVNANFQIDDRAGLAFGWTAGKRMPTPQQLYWQANQFQGNRNLQAVKLREMHAKLYFSPFHNAKVGAGAYLEQIKNGIMIGSDSTFANQNIYSSLSTDAFFHYNSFHFEFSGSATLQQFGNFM
ncbi:MAG TPA: hypothetical protein VE868_12830, partial [Balneolaceae bacterium]|nr:hypothetical protein [Balneolaceae bacterium]